MLQGSPSRCNWGILWDSLIIRWDRSICWIIRIVVEGSFRILQGFVGIVRFVESFELWLRDPLGFFGIPEGFLRNSWGIFWKLAIGNLSNHFHQLVMGFLRISWRSSIVFQPFFSFFLSLSLLLSVSLLLLFCSAVLSFIYLFFFVLPSGRHWLRFFDDSLWGFFVGPIKRDQAQSSYCTLTWLLRRTVCIIYDTVATRS